MVAAGVGRLRFTRGVGDGGADALRDVEDEAADELGDVEDEGADASTAIVSVPDDSLAMSFDILRGLFLVDLM